MATTEKERVKTSLSEVRMLVLGAQILLGFQYRASFEPGFPLLPQGAQYLQVAALVLLVASAACMIAPAPYHRIVSRGHATARTERYTKRMALLALVPLALGVAGDMFVVADVVLGGLAATTAGLACAAGMAALWFGMPLLAVRRNPG